MLKTPFHKFHVEHEAKLVDFAGWEMPIMYSSIHEEHNQVRNEGGFFDVSHMGRIKFSGRDAKKLLELILTRHIGDMTNGQCRYSLICNEQGGVLDDVLIYRFDYDWLLVVNASNREKILAHLQTHAKDLAVKIEDQTEATAMIALQGPSVMDQIAQFSTEVPALKRYHFCIKNLFVLKMTISRTGYTGEDGVEIMLPANMAAMAIKMLLKEKANEEGKSISIKPAGLGARDTLRMEAAMPLYGHELDEDTDPISAGLHFAVSLDKADEHPFIGCEALKKISAEGPQKKLVGLKLNAKRTARQGMPVYKDGKKIGTVTSGCLSPTLGYLIAMAYVQPDSLNLGETASINLGSKTAEALAVKLPFYKRA